MTHHHTHETTRQALAHIPANLPRDEWTRVGMAIKSEFPDEGGFDLFAEWSATAPEFKASDCRTAWRSFKAGGSVTMGSLIHIAKQHGYVMPKDGQAAAKPSPEVLAQRQREQAEAQAREAEAQRQRHEAVAAAALKAWEAGSDQGESAYLVRKGVKGYGLRYTAADGALMVPLRDLTGKLWNLQNVKPDGQKRFLKDGRKSGLWHLLGAAPAPAAVAGAGARDGDQAGEHGGDHAAAVRVILVAEGYATAASLHQATGFPVAVAFDVGNMGKVAHGLRQLHPAARLVLCGDDDQATFTKTGSNPGKIKATAAAVAVHGLAVFPLDLAADQSDFNDMHQVHGLDAVRDCVLSAIAEHELAALAAQDDAPDDVQDAPDGATRPANTPGKTKPLARKKKPSSGAGAGAAGGHGGHDDHGGGGARTGGKPANEWDRFSVTDDGVFYAGVDKEGDTKAEWLCSRLEVLAFTRDQDGGGWGYLLRFSDPLHHVKTWAMPARMLSGDGNEYRQYLMGQGLRIGTSPRARNLLTQYIQTRQPEEFTTCTDRIGWHNLAFVLPRETIGDEAERIVFQSDQAMENTFTVKGTADLWRDRVGALCAGNSRLVFAVACAFAGPLLRPAGVESGGFHFRGGSSSGKTTALKVAASVNGGRNYLQRWRTTDNALEAIAAQHCDSLLVLDELAQVDPKTAGECAYMLANESSKARATRNGAPRPRLSWRLLFLSAGELGLADHMAEGMKRARTGQEVRMADIPADAGAGCGMLENLHGMDGGGSAFSRHIVEQAGRCYGGPGRAWLQWLTENAHTLKADLRQRMQAMEHAMIPEAGGGQVQRVGLRFALVGAAGEMATKAGLTGWEPGESARAAKVCFDAWLASRGGTGDGEVTAMLRQVRAFLESHGEGRFTWWHRAGDDHAAKTLNRAGFRQLIDKDGNPIKTNAQFQRTYGEKMASEMAEETSTEYFIHSEVFKAEVCRGFEAATVARVLLDRDCLVSQEKGRYDCKPRLPGVGPSRCYRISPAIFALDL
jgi:putative DNA primase/helicase